jgi:polyhydroxyalkanoate synthesis regulator phasin
MSEDTFDRFAHAKLVIVVQGEQAVSAQQHGEPNTDEFDKLKKRVAELESRVQAA